MNFVHVHGRSLYIVDRRTVVVEVGCHTPYKMEGKLSGGGYVQGYVLQTPCPGPSTFWFFWLKIEKYKPHLITSTEGRRLPAITIASDSCSPSFIALPYTRTIGGTWHRRLASYGAVDTGAAGSANCWRMLRLS